jgi:small subunit ribosomal protein S9
MSELFIATGRRKTAIARVRLSLNGDGTIIINDKPMEEYFPGDLLRAKVLRPLMLTQQGGRVNGCLCVRDRKSVV